MSEPTLREIRDGAFAANVFDFANAGDVLPMHVHDATDAHYSIVARGSLVVNGIGWEKTLHSGDIIKIEPGQYHGFTALEPRTRVVNAIYGVLRSEGKTENGNG